MYTLSPEQILTISVLCIWFVFPIGMFIAVMKQQGSEVHDHLSNRIPEDQLNIASHVQYLDEANDEDDDDDFEGDDSDEDFEINLPHEIPSKSESHSSHMHQ